LLRADANPGGRPAKEGDAEVAAHSKPVGAVERCVAAVGATAGGVVDGPPGPATRLTAGRFQFAQDLQTNHRALPKRFLGVLPIAQRAAVLVEWGPHPHHLATERVPTRSDLDLSSPAFGIPT